MSDNDAKREEYLALCHAMQSGVAAKMQYDPKETEPKHLRVGVNVALCDHGALVRLLVEKGVITHEEYVEAITEEMRHEVQRYETALRERYGANITLG